MTSLIKISSGTAWGERDKLKKQAPALVGAEKPPVGLTKGGDTMLAINDISCPEERTAGNEEVTDVE